MTRLKHALSLLFGLVPCVVSAQAWEPLRPEHLSPEPVVIEVAADDLARCLATVAQVLAPLQDDTETLAELVPVDATYPVAAYLGPQVTCKAVN